MTYDEEPEDDQIDDPREEEGIQTCYLCGGEDGDCSLNCPNNDSPYAHLIQHGYD